MRRRKKTRWAPWGCAVILFLLITSCLSSCLLCWSRGHGAGGGSYESDPDYDRGEFVLVDGRYRYERDGIVCFSTGVDVSDHQGHIDWYAVASDGIDFALLRVGYRGTTEGLLHRDACFEENYQGALDAGIVCGAYFFSQATSVEEAREEAAFVLEVLNGRWLEFPLAFDYEVEPDTRVSAVGSQIAPEVAQAFCEAIEAGGYETMLYGNTYDLARMESEANRGRDIWCAEYDDSPSLSSLPRFWQYSNAGVVMGIDTYVDLNLDLSEASGL